MTGLNDRLAVEENVVQQLRDDVIRRVTRTMKRRTIARPCRNHDRNPFRYLDSHASVRIGVDPSRAIQLARPSEVKFGEQVGNSQSQRLAVRKCQLDPVSARTELRRHLRVICVQELQQSTFGFARRKTCRVELDVGIGHDKNRDMAAHASRWLRRSKHRLPTTDYRLPFFVRCVGVAVHGSSGHGCFGYRARNSFRTSW